MWKKGLRSAGIGFLVGIALNEIIAVVASYWLRLEYYMPCLASLPEQVGGEMNAVVLQMLVFGCIGMGIGVAWCIGHLHHWKLMKRILGVSCSLTVSIMQAVLVTASMLR